MQGRIVETPNSFCAMTNVQFTMLGEKHRTSLFHHGQCVRPTTIVPEYFVSAKKIRLYQLPDVLHILYQWEHGHRRTFEDCAFLREDGTCLMPFEVLPKRYAIN